jgi:hypothetical protein
MNNGKFAQVGGESFEFNEIVLERLGPIGSTKYQFKYMEDQANKNKNNFVQIGDDVYMRPNTNYTWQ